MLIAQWQEKQPYPVEIERGVPTPDGTGMRMQPVHLPPRRVRMSGPIVGYVTNVHGQVCAVCKCGNRLKDVPLVDLTILEAISDHPYRDDR
jgi:hypothetical protein